MIAPRVKLWSTPIEAIDIAIEQLALSNDDICYDIGAGDGRFLFRFCELSPGCCVGIEIDVERCQNISHQIEDKNISSVCQIICGNALEQDYKSATHFFLYLIPRGMKIVYKEILSKIINKKIRLVTFMNPLPDVLQPIHVIKISTSQHPEAQWPLYVYEMYNQADENTIEV